MLVSTCPVGKYAWVEVAMAARSGSRLVGGRLDTAGVPALAGGGDTADRLPRRSHRCFSFMTAAVVDAWGAVIASRLM